MGYKLFTLVKQGKNLEKSPSSNALQKFHIFTMAWYLRLIHSFSHIGKCPESGSEDLECKTISMAIFLSELSIFRNYSIGKDNWTV